MFIITQKTTTTPGSNIVIDCPSCNSSGVGAGTFDVEERNRFFGFIPFFTSRWVSVECESCHKQFGSPQSCEELARMSRQEVSQLLAIWQETNVAFLVKFCVIVSLLIGILPFAGLPFGIIGVAATFRRRTKWRAAARIGLGLPLFSSLVAVVLVIAQKFSS